MRIPTLALATALSATCFATTNAEEKRQLGAHEHGHGSFSIAVEDKTISMELEAPGADIAGFEHEAKSDADKAAIANAKAKLADPLKLFVLNAEAGCKLAKQSVELHGVESDEHDHKHGHDEKKGHKHDHDKHDEKHKADGASHNEFHAEYTLTCDAPNKLTSIKFAYFETFKGAKELEVKLVSANKQSAYEVTRDKPVLDLQGSM